MTTQDKKPVFDTYTEEERNKSYEEVLNTHSIVEIQKFSDSLSPESQLEFKNFIKNRRDKITDKYYEKGYMLNPENLKLIKFEEAINRNLSGAKEKKTWYELNEEFEKTKIIEDKKSEKDEKREDKKSLVDNLASKAKKTMTKNITVDTNEDARKTAITNLDKALEEEVKDVSLMDYNFGKVLANKSSVFESYTPYINKLKVSLANFREMSREQLNLLAPFYSENVTKFYTETEISQYLYMSPFLGSFTKLSKRVITFTLVQKNTEKKEKLKMQDIYSDLFTKAGITFNAKFFGSLQSKCIEIILCLLKYSIKPLDDNKQFYTDYEINYLTTESLLEALKGICSYKLESVWDAETLRAFSQEHTNRKAFFDVLEKLKDDSALPYLKIYLFNNLVDKFVFQLRGLENGKPEYPSEELLKKHIGFWSSEEKAFKGFSEMLMLKKDRTKKTIEKNLGLRKTKNQGDKLRDYQHACYGYILKAIKGDEFSYNSSYFKVTKEE